MTTAESLAAAAADECRKVLAEKDRLLEQARDERDAARTLAEKQATVIAATARTAIAAERALSEAREALRGLPCMFVWQAKRARLVGRSCLSVMDYDGAGLPETMLCPVCRAVSSLAAPVPPGETTPTWGEKWGRKCAAERCTSSAYPGSTLCWSHGGDAAPAAHPETTPAAVVWHEEEP